MTFWIWILYEGSADPQTLGIFNRSWQVTNKFALQEILKSTVEFDVVECFQKQMFPKYKGSIFW